MEARLQGQDSQDLFNYENSPGKTGVRDGFVAKEGEIRQEFDHYLKIHVEDLENQNKKEAEATSEFIRRLQVTIHCPIHILFLLFKLLS